MNFCLFSRVRSGKRMALLPVSPLRTVRESFSYGSSFQKVPSGNLTKQASFLQYGMAFPMHLFPAMVPPSMSEHQEPWKPVVRLSVLHTQAAAALDFSTFKSFASVGAVQHFLTITLFIITIPPRIERICFGNDLLKR